jgi:fused signal recognition particle receptor
LPPEKTEEKRPEVRERKPPKKAEPEIAEKKTEAPKPEKAVPEKPAIEKQAPVPAREVKTPEKPPEAKHEKPGPQTRTPGIKPEPKIEIKPEPKVEDKIKSPIEDKKIENKGTRGEAEGDVLERRAVQDSQEATGASWQSQKPKERIRLGIVGTVKSIITREVTIEEKDVKEMLESLELELLEADVELSVAGAIMEALREKLVGAKIGKGELHSFVSRSIRETLIEILSNEKKFTIPERLEGAEKPLKIMFLGINGAGKTTTIAKVGKLLLNDKRKVVFAAADTFRAAAIEQMGVHAERLGVKVIKREYGSDPTSVAFDAVNYARAHGIDAVLIDTAGRQDTNISLMNEMKKMNRVIQPDIKVYIGESIAGNAIIEQISAFNREIGVDAVILTKLDCDPKGGTMLSISKATGIPIAYVGIGQAYDDLEEFDPRKIVERIVE